MSFKKYPVCITVPYPYMTVLYPTRQHVWLEYYDGMVRPRKTPVQYTVTVNSPKHKALIMNRRIMMKILTQIDCSYHKNEAEDMVETDKTYPVKCDVYNIQHDYHTGCLELTV